METGLENLVPCNWAVADTAQVEQWLASSALEDNHERAPTPPKALERRKNAQRAREAHTERLADLRTTKLRAPEHVLRRMILGGDVAGVVHIIPKLRRGIDGPIAGDITALELAVSRGAAEVVRALLQLNADPNQLVGKAPNQDPVLVAAIRNLEVPTAAELVAAGAQLRPGFEYLNARMQDSRGLASQRDLMAYTATMRIMSGAPLTRMVLNGFLDMAFKHEALNVVQRVTTGWWLHARGSVEGLRQ
eukprot:TRINITY_DN6227_c0_g1_i1.p1 TRINITY_DN6227_c0_g1~~TRINITY_DN6227_c0_g1_i1.p1  ORF type:complete len:248 (+),score=53.40 TRINITY_DN6227_c0_g1_i1:214-957(+)